MLSSNIAGIELGTGAHVLMLPTGVLLPLDKAASYLAAMKRVVCILPVSRAETLTLALWESQSDRGVEGWSDLYRDVFLDATAQHQVKSGALSVNLKNSEALSVLSDFEFLTGSISAIELPDSPSKSYLISGSPELPGQGPVGKSF